MAKIVINRFGGTAPRIDARKLTEPLAQVSQNAKLWSGALRAFNTPLSVNTPSKVGTKRTVYRFGATPGADASGAVTGATQANPVVITAVAHGRTTGDRVFLADIGGMTQINNLTFTVTVTDSNHYSLNGINGTAYSAYTSGGTWTKENGYWFHWTETVDVIRGPIAGDTTERTYYTGVGAPKVTDSSVALGVGTDYPLVSYDLGIPKPASAITATPISVAGAITGATQANPVKITSTAHGRETGQEVTIASVSGMTQLNGNRYTLTRVDADHYTLDGVDGTAYSAYTSGGTWTLAYAAADLEARSYVYTYVSQWGEEGPPSDPSTYVDVGPSQQVTAAGMSTAPGGTWNVVTAKRIYRTITGTTEATYQFVKEIAVATTSTTDAVLGQNLGETLPSADWIAPPSDMHSIVCMPNGITVGLSKNDVCPSVAFQPHAYPTEYRQTMDYPGIAQAVIGQSAVIGTQAYPYLLTGVDPESLTLTRMDANQSCASARSMVAIPGSGVVYASPDGLVLAGPEGVKVVTEQWLSRDEWNYLYKPSSIVGATWEGRYIAFYDNGGTQAGFIFDPRDRESGLIDISTYATAAFNDALSDSLYLMIGSQIKKFDGSAAKQSYTWRSKKFRSETPINFGAAFFVADSFTSLTLKTYADGTLKQTKTVTSQEPFKLLSGFKKCEWEFEITGTDNVSKIAIGETVDDLKDA